MEIVFPPACIPSCYYKVHVRYIIESARAAGLEVSISEAARPVEGGRFEAIVDGRTVLFDFDDFPRTTPLEVQYEHVFKFHTEEGHPRNIHPFPTVSFYDWERYRTLRQQIHYAADSERIISRQRPYAGARTRRTHVQRLLQRVYGDQVSIGAIRQEAYWREVGDCLAHVFVPGARNDMLDRGMAQWMAFGACVIAPPIRTLLPYGRRLEPGIHFVECRPDYVDLTAQIEWCRENRDSCRTIGRNAARLFRECCEPQAVWEWVRVCLAP